MPRRSGAFESLKPGCPIHVARAGRFYLHWRLGACWWRAGMFLFVEAHWDTLSPFARVAIVMFTLAALHTGAAFSGKFPALATTLHAVGTAGLGGAIAVAGQVFHMDQHWPAAVLLWAIGAWAGVVLLRDLPQLVMAAILTPAWIASELIGDRTYLHNADPWIAALLALVALTYLGANRTAETAVWRHVLAAIGAVAVLPCAVIAIVMATTHVSFQDAWLLLLPLPVAIGLRGRAAWPVAGWAVWLVLQVAAVNDHMTVFGHMLAGAASVALAGWGIAELRKERVNLGMAAFVITVGSFYFNFAVDKLDRSLGLIVMGLFFLAGGWQLERLRRSLIQRIEGARAV
ncbi:MAG: DUF2157 domain-containing protein [Acidobacteriota bacterium]